MISLLFRTAEGEQLQHGGLERAGFVELPGFDRILRIQADRDGLLYLTAGIALRLAKVLIGGKGRNTQRGPDFGDGLLFVLHDLDMLQETVLPQQHGEDTETGLAVLQQIPQEREGPDTVPGHHGVHRGEDDGLRRMGGQRADVLGADGGLLRMIRRDFGDLIEEQGGVVSAGENQKIRCTRVTVSKRTSSQPGSCAPT